MAEPLNVGGVVFTVDADFSKAQQKSDAFKRGIAETNVVIGGSGGGGGAGGSSMGTSNNVTHGSYDLNRGSTWDTGGQRYNLRTQSYGGAITQGQFNVGIETGNYIRQQQEAEKQSKFNWQLKNRTYNAEQKAAADMNVDRGGARSMLSNGSMTGEMPWGASSRINRFTGERLGETEEEIDPKAKAVAGKDLSPLRMFMRTSIAGFVIDIIGTEVGNLANWQKGMTLAGLNSGNQALATTAGIRGTVSSVPLIGPALAGMLAPVLNPIETDVEMTQRQGASDDIRMSNAMSIAFTRRNAQSVSFGRNRYGRRDFDIGTETKEATEAKRKANLQEDEAFKSSHAETDRPFDSYINIVSYAAWKMQQGKEGPDINGVGQKALSKQQDLELATISDLGSRKLRQSRLDFQEDFAIDSAKTQGELLAADKRPFAGSQANLRGGMVASFNRFQQDARTDQGDAIQTNSLMSSYAQAKTSYQDAADQMLFGKTIEFDPFNQSADKFQTKETETPESKMAEATASMAVAVSLLQQVLAGRPN